MRPQALNALVSQKEGQAKLLLAVHLLSGEVPSTVVRAPNSQNVSPCMSGCHQQMHPCLAKLSPGQAVLTGNQAALYGLPVRSISEPRFAHLFLWRW